ncbi:FG-GAP-like repeat-containing protein [Lewinella sp. LCG006]|uniref:FG-GAP-like repeat-containing protein n=1 Tax=Lewinella sp. LCG006 TaxID=3231911 RepID=UPI00345F8CE8
MKQYYSLLFIQFLLLSFSPPFFAQQFSEISEELGMIHHFDDWNSIGGGAAFFDYDNDGDDDLYFTGGKFSDRLYRNEGDGTFTDVTEESGLQLTATYFTTGVTVGDIDNDGYRDIFVTTFGFLNSLAPDKRNLLYKNMGDGTFQEIAPLANLSDASRSVSATFLDHDQDGFLDLYIVNYVDRVRFIYGEDGMLSGFDHDCYENFFFHNNGNGTFTQVARQLNLEDAGCGLAIVNTDYDMDGDADLYLANDFGEFIETNQMYINNLTTGVYDTIPGENDINIGFYGMGIAVGDYDLDQDFDYYVSNLGANAFLNNDGNGQFTNIAEQAGVPNTMTDNNLLVTSWGTVFADIDNNLYEDLLVSNGHIPAAAFIATDHIDPNKLYYNNGDNTFTDISVAAGFDSPEKCRGLVYSDFDQDGDLDFFVNVMSSDSFPDAHVRFYRNDLANNNNWVQISLEGTHCNRDAIGAIIRLFVDDLILLREISGGGSHASQNSTIAHFGLADHSTIDSVQVSWPGGEVETFYDLDINQRHHLIQALVPRVRINFNVDMSFQEESPQGVFLKVTNAEGDIQSKLMYAPFLDGMYSVSFLQEPGFSGYYTIINGYCPDDTCGEDLSEEGCDGLTPDFKRLLEPVFNDTTINLCFGICAGIPCQSTVDSINAHFTLNAAPLNENLQQIFIRGLSPNGEDLPMNDPDGDGTYELSINLAEGYSAYYTYVNGECSDESCTENLSEQGCTDEANNYYRYLPPMTQDTMLAACFGVCNTDSCFAPIDTFRLTINLNMTNEALNPTGVFIIGDFFGLSGASPMYDGDDDGIYTNFFDIPEGFSTYYSFTNGSNCPGTTCYEDLSGQACASIDQNNFRYLNPITSDTIINLCFGECQLAACFPPADSVDIQINLNTAAIDVAEAGIYLVEGAFGSPGENPMEDNNGDGVYSITLRVPEGFSGYYSFTNGLCFDLSCKEDLNGQDCGPPNANNNRWLPPVMQDTIINTCFAECIPDLDCTLPPSTTPVTFGFHDPLSGEAAVFLTGEFGLPNNDFELTESPASSGDWFVTLDLIPATYYYRFGTGTPMNGILETFPLGQADTCTVDLSGERFRVITVEDTALELEPVCFELCNYCEIIYNVTNPMPQLRRFQIQPNPTSGATMLSWEAVGADRIQIRLINTIGQVIEQFDLPAGVGQLFLSTHTLPAGIYWVSLETEGGYMTRKLIVQ